MIRKTLLIIDPQNDFVDTSGSLYISGAEDCVKRLCKFVNSGNWNNIIVTQDSHYSYHIGHSVWWEQMPPEFTKITLKDIQKSKYTPMSSKVTPEFLEWYFKNIPGQESTIWPEHCIIGSWGWCFPDRLVQALNLWSLKNEGKLYSVIQKGSDPDFEMYSAFSVSTDFGKKNIKFPEAERLVEGCDELYITGFAKDVCVSWTIQDLLKIPGIQGKLRFVDSCMTEIGKNSERLKVFDNAVKNYGALWVEKF